MNDTNDTETGIYRYVKKKNEDKNFSCIHFELKLKFRSNSRTVPGNDTWTFCLLV